MGKTIDSVIGDVIRREGGPTDDPQDKGGPTAWGISKVANPEAWKDGPPSEAEARAIYLRKYVQGPGFDKIEDKALQAQLVDFGVNSGPAIAIMKLQGILSVPMDGVLGPQTLAALTTLKAEEVNNLLVATRVKMVVSIAVKNPGQLRFLSGWVDRSLQFLE